MKMYFLKPVAENEFVVLNTKLEEVDFETTPTQPGRFQLDVDGEEFIVADWAVTNAYQSGTYLKLDPNGVKIRQITPQKAAEMFKLNANVLSSGDDLDFDIDSLDIQETYLKDIQWDPKMFEPIKTGTFYDTFVSNKGGIIPATNTMITGDPGIGKSSNMIEMLCRIKQQDPTKRVAYISAEMEHEDVKEFEQYYPGINEIPFLFIGDYLYGDNPTPIWQVLTAFLNKGWDAVVLDSLVEIQMIIQEELNLPQKKGEAFMLKLMRQHNKGNNKTKCYTAFMCIQQKNKGGQYVGSKRLEHMTTAFLQLLWDPKEKGKRFMVFEKNRKGSVKAKLYYGFAKEGGIEYDSKRYQQELEMVELCRMSGTDPDSIENLGLEEFTALFKKEEKENSNG